MSAELWQILRGELDAATAERLIDRIARQMGGKRPYITCARPSKRSISAAWMTAEDWRAVAEACRVSRATAYRYRG